MNRYAYYIAVVGTVSDTSGEGFVGPFATEEERDVEASRLRKEEQEKALKLRKSYKRANIKLELVEEVTGNKVAAAA